MNYTLIDTHCHITSDSLFERIEEVLLNAKKANVEEMMVVCTDFKSYTRAKNLQELHPKIKIAFGFHPSDLYDFKEEDYLRLEEMVKNKEIDALGEIGLDYHWDDVSKEEQKKGFVRQLEIANKYNMPVIIHMRDATKDTLDLLKEYGKTKFVMHCFSGSVETAKEVMRRGGYISFAGPITFKNARGLTEIPQVCFKDKIFVETDCPYLTPHPFRGKQNEPMYVQYTFKKVCELLEEEEEVMAKQMKNNFYEFLK